MYITSDEEVIALADKIGYLETVIKGKKLETLNSEYQKCGEQLSLVACLLFIFEETPAVAWTKLTAKTTFYPKLNDSKILRKHP